MKYILSWGGGVNSTAILAMIKLGMLPELNKDNTHIIMADTGVEMPYTYEHTSRCLQPMSKEGWTCKVLHPDRNTELYNERVKNKTLVTYCLDKKIIPSRINRWCTVEFKTTPIKNYRTNICGENWKYNSAMILGIANEEKHRAKELGCQWTLYPLIKHKIDRYGCLELIQKAKLPIARKSGCRFCPYQRKAQWLELYRNYPELFNEAEELERTAQEKYKGGRYYLCRDMPIREQVKKWLRKEKEKCNQKEFWNEYRHCVCEL